jgi:4-hydroxy-3-methylbut-2-en-1-yl diphosphate reductase
MTVLALAPLRVEAAALRPARELFVIRAGMGARRARIAAARGLAVDDARGVVVAGVCGAVGDDLRPGDVVLGSEMRRPDGTRIPAAASVMLAARLRALGLRVHVGPIASTERLLRRSERRRLADEGVLAVDMESAWLAEAAAGRPLAVVRTVVESADRDLLDPRTPLGGMQALRSLRRAVPALDDWAGALRPRRILLAAPRSFCAGVDRAIEIVELALEQRGAPVYVRKQIVHNEHVVADLESRGAIFVDEIDEVPEGATTVFSAHGVSPEVKRIAAKRSLDVIDATCPLVNKVHAEARRFAAAGKTIILIGHAGHEEVEGTSGEAPEAIRLVQDLGDVAQVEVEDPEQVAYLTQTTLAVDETVEIVDALRGRFPALRGPSSDDICYATANRQQAVREIASESDVVLVVGSLTSSNSRRLVEVAEREGTRAHLIDDETEIDVAWLRDAGTIGLSAGASAPEHLVGGVIDAVAALGGATVDEHTTTIESLHFRLPQEVARR